jgi:hypothetical protein
MAVKMEVLGFVSVLQPEALAVSGSAGTDKRFFPGLKRELEGVAKVYRLSEFAASIGAAEIARDALNGKKDFLGIGLKL